MAGPFDAGMVVVREALRLNPITARAEVDGAASDPIPHILKGIPLNLRDLRVYADRPEFTLNATSCEPFAAESTIWGDGTALEPLAETPGLPLLALPGRRLRLPRLQAQARDQPQGRDQARRSPGAESRGHPQARGRQLRQGRRHPAALRLPRPGPHPHDLHPRAVRRRGGQRRPVPRGRGLRPRQGLDARCWTNRSKARSSCAPPPTTCPTWSSPCTASSNIDLASRIDSVHGGIRSTFEDIPDAPVSRFILEMQGGKKGLIVNSTNLCSGKHRAKAKLTGQNGRVDSAKPLVRARCGKAHREKHKHHVRHERHKGKKHQHRAKKTEEAVRP